MEKQKIVESMLKETEERWGMDEAKTMEPVIRRIAEAVWKVGCIDLEPEDDASSPLKVK